jgi:hypothetical protein
MAHLGFFPPDPSPEETAESNLRKLKDGGLMVHFMLDPVRCGIIVIRVIGVSSKLLL